MTNEPYRPTERRPITARGWSLWQRTATWLARRGVTANQISLAGMGFGLASGAAFAATGAVGAWHPLAWILAAAFAQLRLLANLLDGMVAIETATASRVGELYNEVPDRVSDAAIFIGAGYALGGHVTWGYAAACLAIFTAYVRAVGKTAGAPQDYCGPMAKPQRMAVMMAAAILSALMPQAVWPRLSWLGDGGLAAAGLVLVALGSLITAVRRLLRIAKKLHEVAP